MDLSKEKSQKITSDPVYKIDDYDNDQLGTLKLQRRWKTMRDEVVQSLLDSYKKIQRARKLNPKVRAIFKIAQKIREENEAGKKKGASLKEFFDSLSQIKATTDYYHLNELTLDDLKDIQDFVNFIMPLAKKGGPEIEDIVSTWQNTLQRVVDSYPDNFDDYAKEVVREIMDTIFDYADEMEERSEAENVELATSPFFSSEIEIAITGQNKGDYENM